MRFKILKAVIINNRGANLIDEAFNSILCSADFGKLLSVLFPDFFLLHSLNFP